MLPQTTILVTGAAGALGRVVFASLQREGYRVRGFDRPCCSMSRPFSTRLRERFGSHCLTFPNLLHIKSFPHAISIFTDSFCDLHAVLPA